MGIVTNFFCLSLLIWASIACQPPDCDSPDCGSCGNACCVLKIKVAVSPDEVYQALIGNLKAGGADKNYTFVHSVDMRNNKLSDGVKYTVQATHSVAGQNYLDSINMAVSSTESGVTFIQAFSISQKEGNFCDNGQNYKNLITLFNGVAQLYAHEVVYGCTNKTKPN